MENDNQQDVQARLLNAIQGIEQANKLMDEANTNLDRAMNQDPFQNNCIVKLSQCLTPLVMFFLFGMFCALIIFEGSQKFETIGVIAFPLVLYIIIYLCCINSQTNILNTKFGFLRVAPINKEEFLLRINEIFNTKPKVTLSGEVYKFSPTTFYIENGVTKFKHKIINSINENYSFNLCKDWTHTIKLNSEIFRGKKLIVFYFQTAVAPGDAETFQDFLERKRVISERLGNVGIENPTVNDMQRIVRGELLRKECKLKGITDGINNKEKCLVLSLDGTTPCWYGTWLYYLFTFCPFLPFVEYLKMHIRSVTAFKVVTLTKAISIKEQSESLADRQHNVVFPDDEIAMVEINNNEENNNNVAIPINNVNF